MRIPWPLKPKGMGVLMVCRANICRSPMAEAILRRKLEVLGLSGRVGVVSAGTHVTGGQPPDPRVLDVLEESGIYLKRKKSRSIRSADFERHTHILAMDEENLEHLEKICPEAFHHRLHLVTDFSRRLPPEGIPDPYFGNLEGFARVRELLETALDDFLDATLLPPLPGDEELS